MEIDNTDNTAIGDIITPVSANFNKAESELNKHKEGETDGIVNVASEGKEKNNEGVTSNFSSTPNLLTA